MSTHKLSKFHRECVATLDAAAFDMNMIGVFEYGQPHSCYRVVLPDNSIVKIPVYNTPKDADGYIIGLPGRLRRNLLKHLQERGVM